MKRFGVAQVAGLFLVLVGLVMVLQNTGVLAEGADLIWGVIFGAAGVIFLYLYISNPDHWWTIFPGCAGLGIAAIMLLEEIFPRAEGDLGAMVFLFLLSAAFWVIYFRDRENWWTIIPGGILLTVGLTVGSSALSDDLEGGVFFIGIGLTFGLLYLLSPPENRLKWALIPAGILILFGALIAASSTSLMDWLVPVALIAVGAYFVFRALVSRSRS